jgi:hypothetical protein
MTAVHLQECPTYEEQRRKIWPKEIPVKDKLYGNFHDLQMTATTSVVYGSTYNGV